VSPSRPGAHLAGRSISIEVPATSANLGAGFDSLAMALDMVNTVRVEALPVTSASDVVVHVVGEGAGQLPTGRHNRFVAALFEGLSEAGLDGAGLGWRVEMDNGIPVARGLGSSAAATVAGLLAADALTDGGLGRQRILELASGAEGHADNAAAATYGGICVVASIDGHPGTVRLDPPARLLVVLYVPDRHLSTVAMRSTLPAMVPLADAVHNVAAAALTVAALCQGRLELLAAASLDRLHEPYRATVYQESPDIIEAAREAGALGACLSGAGSTLVAFSDSRQTAAAVAAAMERRGMALGLAGRSRVQAIRADGARVVADETGPGPGLRQALR